MSDRGVDVWQKLVASGALTEGAVERARAAAQGTHRGVGYHLVQQGSIAESDLVRALAEVAGLPAADLRDFTPDPTLLRLIPADLGVHLSLIPLAKLDGRLRIAGPYPEALAVLDDLVFITRMPIDLSIAGEHELASIAERWYSDDSSVSFIQLCDLLELPTAPPEPAEDGRTVRAWFGTNRQVDVTSDGIAFLESRDTVTRYGYCDVFVPRSHRIGSLGSPFWRRWITGTDDRIRVARVATLEADAMWEDVRRGIRTDVDGVVFLHGFNVSFEDAARRSAQLACDLDLEGPMAFFSWPSHGRVLKYLADGAAIEASEAAITDFLRDFSSKTGIRRLHVIAHSMGTRGLMRAMQRIVGSGSGRQDVRLGQVILAAADIDRDVFLGMASALSAVAEHATMYVSREDMALKASGHLHDFPRAGLVPPLTTAVGVDTIVVGGVDVSMLAHGYVATTRELLTDIFGILRHGAKPADRMGLSFLRSQQGDFWYLRS